MALDGMKVIWNMYKIVLWNTQKKRQALEPRSK